MTKQVATHAARLIRGRTRPRSLVTIFLLVGVLTACSTKGAPTATLEAKAQAGDESAQAELCGNFGAKNDYAHAEPWCRKAAEQGDGLSQVTLGMMYLEGKAVPMDNTQGQYWVQKSAAGGQLLAQRILCTYGYPAGKGDNDKARETSWCQKAANQGDADSQYQLGMAYSLGTGVPRNFSKAAIWLQKSAEQGHADAQVTLGGVYALGVGVKQDFKEAYFWSTLGSLGKCHWIKCDDVQVRVAMKGSLRPWEVADVDKRVQDWLKAHPTRPE